MVIVNGIHYYPDRYGQFYTGIIMVTFVGIRVYPNKQ